MLVPSTLIASIITLALWLPATDQASITAFAAMYGTFTGTLVYSRLLPLPNHRRSFCHAAGAFVSLLPAYVYTISPIEVYGARLGETTRFCASPDRSMSRSVIRVDVSSGRHCKPCWHTNGRCIPDNNQPTRVRRPHYLHRHHDRRRLVAARCSGGRHRATKAESIG